MYTYAYNFVFAAATDVNPGLPAPVFGIGVEKGAYIWVYLHFVQSSPITTISNCSRVNRY